MKIALVCPYDIAYPGGVQNHILQFASYAKRHGHQVTVLAPSSRENSYADYTGIDIVRIGGTVPLPVGMGTVARLSLFCNKPVMREHLATGKYDVVHMHSPEVPRAGLLALKLANPDLSCLITTFHSNITPNGITWGYSTLVRLLRLHHRMDKVHARIAVSPAAASKASHYLPGNYKVIPNGIDVERFSPAVKPIEQYIDGKINVLFVGRMGDNERRKGLYYLVSAFRELHFNHPNTRLLIVGPGNPDTETRRLLDSVNENESGIVLVGGVPASELPRYYATAHIFAATPTDGESFSLVVAEAMASGKPVVTTNIPGPRDVLLGYREYGSDVISSNFFVAEAGILAPARNVSATAAALEKLVLDEAARAGMGKRGREIVVENFSWDVVAPQILHIYEETLKKRRNGSNSQLQQQEKVLSIA